MDEYISKEFPTADVQFINKDFLLWLLKKAMECMCDGRFCENCFFEKENNPYNTYCSKLTFEQLLSMCDQWYRKDCETNE